MSAGKINIYEANGTLIKEAIVTANAKHEQELMKSDFVSLEWKDSEYIVLPVGSYIMPFGDGENDPKYKLFDSYKPNNNGGVYEYKPKFEAPKMILAHTPCLFKTYNSHEEEVWQTDWVFTGSINLIVGRLQTIIEEQIGYHLEPHIIIKSTTSLPASATCNFSGVDILSALNEVCNQFGGLEWHIEWGDGRTGGDLYVGNVLIGNETITPSEDGVEHIDMTTLTPKASLVEGGNVQTASKNENKEKFANYFIVRGGTRNITIETPSGNNVQTDTRLTIDDIDTRTDKVREPKIQRVLIFDDVYPKLDLYAYNIRKRTRRLKDEEGHYIPKTYNQDGSVKDYKMYSIYYMRLAYFTNEQKTEYDDFLINPKTDIVAGKKLMCSFEANEEGTHSELAGREFELIYHSVSQSIEPNPSIDDTGIQVLAGDYEIVYEQEDDFIIPNDDTLEPWGEQNAPTEQCDIVVLVNIVMGETYLDSAKAELATVANKEIERIQSDNNNYTVKSNAIAFDANNPNLSIGDYVSFTTQNGDIADSRILKLVTNLDYPIQQDITIGNAVIKGSTQSLTEDVKSLSAAIDINESSATTINKMISQLYRLIREYDSVFLHKDENDATPFKLGAESLEVEHGAKVGGNLTVGAEDRAHYIYPALKVFANLLRTELGGALQTYDYQKDMEYGTGWGVDKDGNMQVESLEVRSALRVLELVYNRLSAEESEYVFTEAGTIEKVVPSGDNYICTLEKRNETDFHAFHCGDVLRGIVNDLTELGGGTYYTCWLEVIDTDTSVPDGSTERNNTITVKMYAGSDCPSGSNYPPMEHMVVQRWGNSVIPSATTHADEMYRAFIEQKDGKWVNRRQSCWYISSIEKRIMFLDHVSKPKINEGNYAAFFGLPVNISSFKGHSLDPTQPYLYCRGVFLQDIHFINYLGKEYKVERDRGAWSAETAASQDDPYIVDYATYQTVTHNNCKWECVSEVPAVYEPSTDNTSEWKLLKENIEPPVYTLITNVKTVIRDSEGTPNVDVVKCYVRKTLDEATTNDTQNQLGYLYYSINGENLRRGSEVELAKDDGIKSIRFVFYPRKTEEFGNAVFGQTKLGTAQIEAIVDVLDEARGEKGERGVTLRVTTWEANKHYESGADGEDYQDIVICEEYPNEMYLCKVTHDSNRSTNYPPEHYGNADWDSETPWTGTEYREFIATKVLFANRGKIENADITNVTIRGTITEDCKVHNKDYNPYVIEPPTYEEQGYDYDPTDPRNLVEIVGSDVESKEGSLYSVSCELAILNGEDAQGHVEHNWEDDVVRINNQIVQLPTYNKVRYYKGDAQSTEVWFHSNPYKIAGTRLSVFTTQDVQKNWWGIDFDQHESDYIDLLNEGVLVCADPDALLGHILKDGSDLNVRPYHPWNAMSYYNPEDATKSKGLNGRFSFNGRIARFVLLLPGQHLDLISKIEYIPKYDSVKQYYVAEPTLVWDICNASDFDAIDIDVYATNDPTGAQAEGETISDYNGSYSANPTIFGGGGEGGNEAFVCKKLRMDDEHPIGIKLEIKLAGWFANGNLHNEDPLDDIPSWKIKLNPSN